MGEPKFIQKARNDGGIATIANANWDGSGTLATIVEGDAESGIRIDRISFRCSGNTAANSLRIYLCKDNDKRLIHVIPVAATTGSNTAVSWAQDWLLDPPLVLEYGYSLMFAPAVAAAFHASITSGGEL